MAPTVLWFVLIAPYESCYASAAVLGEGAALAYPPRSFSQTSSNPLLAVTALGAGLLTTLLMGVVAYANPGTVRKRAHGTDETAPAREKTTGVHRTSPVPRGSRASSSSDGASPPLNPDAVKFHLDIVDSESTYAPRDPTTHLAPPHGTPPRT